MCACLSAHVVCAYMCMLWLVCDCVHIARVLRVRVCVCVFMCVYVCMCVWACIVFVCMHVCACAHTHGDLICGGCVCVSNAIVRGLTCGNFRVCVCVMLVHVCVYICGACVSMCVCMWE